MGTKVLAYLYIGLLFIFAKKPLSRSVLYGSGSLETRLKNLGKLFINYSILGVGLLIGMNELIISLIKFCLDEGF